MTVITLSIVGFGEVQPLSPLGRVFTSVVVLVGVGTVAFLFSTIIVADVRDGLREPEQAKVPVPQQSEH